MSTTHYISSAVLGTKVDEINLGASQAQVDFLNIPPGGETLIVSWYARCDSNNGGLALRLRFNGDSGSNYMNQTQRGVGSSALSFEELDTTAVHCGSCTDAGNAASYFGNGHIVIPRYSPKSAAKYKAVIARAFEVETAGAGATDAWCNAAIWRDTSVITKVSLIPGVAANFIAGSLFSLYAI